MSDYYVRFDDMYERQFGTTDPSTGEATDDDGGTSVVEIFEDGIPFATQRRLTVESLETGLQVARIFLDADYFLPGKAYTVKVHSTVSTVEGKDGLVEFQFDAVNRYARAVREDDGASPEPPAVKPRFVIAAIEFGAHMNGVTLEFLDDGTGAGSLTQAGSFPTTESTYTFHYEVGVTTFDDLRTALDANGTLRLAALLDGNGNPILGDTTFLSTIVVDADVMTLAGGSDIVSRQQMLVSGRCQAGSTASSVVIEDGGVLSGDFPNGARITTMRGPGSGQTRRIYDYNNGTQTGLIRPDWSSTPTAETTYRIDYDTSGIEDGVVADANVLTWDGDPVPPLDPTTGYMPAIIYEMIPPPGHGSEKRFNRNDTIRFDFFVREAVVTTDGTADWDNGITGLVESDFTLLHKAGNATSFATRADSDHVITETGDGWYKFVSSLAAYGDTDHAHLIRIVYDPGSLPANHDVRDVWHEHYHVTADLTVIIDAAAAVEVKVDAVDTVVDAIKAKTDNLPADPASEASVTSIRNNTRVVRVVPEAIVIPGTGTRSYRIELFLYDDDGNMEVPDSDPTITLVNQAGTSRTSRLSATTMVNIATGHYRVTYTSDAADTPEQLLWTFSVIEGGQTRLYGNTSSVGEESAGGSDAEDIIAALIAYAHDTGVTVGGMLVRFEAWLSGEREVSAGATPDLVHVAYKDKDGVIAMEGDYDPATGARADADVEGSE